MDHGSCVMKMLFYESLKTVLTRKSGSMTDWLIRISASDG